MVNAESVLNDCNEEFRLKYGRFPYPGEPKEGFRAKLFRTTEQDDGTVVIGGYVKEYSDPHISKKFERQKFVMKGIRDPYDILFSSADWTFSVPISYCQMLSRGEFVERLYLIMDFARDNRFLDSSHVLNNIAVIEEFSGTPLPKIVLSALVKHSLGNDSAGVSFRLSEDKTLLLDHTTNKTYCVAKTHHDLEKIPPEVKSVVVARTPDEVPKFLGRLMLLGGREKDWER